MRHYHFIILLFIFLSCSFLFPPEPLDESNIPAIDSSTVYNCPQIRIRASTTIAEKLTGTTPNMEQQLCILEFQGCAYKDVLVSLHGISTLFTRRHSFNIRFPENEDFSIDNHILPFFYLLSLDNDTGYLESPLGYTILTDLGLFLPHFTRVEVLINNQTLGMYLLIEQTADAARQKNNAVEFVMRRRNDDDFTIHYYEPKNQIKTFTTGDYIQAHNTLYHLHELYSGEPLYQELADRMDIQGYMQWLAVNTFLQNSDYNDELFVYACPRVTTSGGFQPYFRFSAWDYDDLFKPPHLGNDIPGSLVYCRENALDVSIAHDPFLYEKFKATFLDLLENQLTESYLKALFQKIETDTEPYLRRKVILAVQNNLAISSAPTWNDYKLYYGKVLDSLIKRRAELLSKLTD